MSRFGFVRRSLAWRHASRGALAALLLIGAIGAQAQVQYARQGVRLMKRIPLAEMPNSPTSGAGCVGYVSPSGQEYACMGVRTGTLVVRITNPANPQVIALVPGLTSTWHEMAVLGSYLYSVADSVNQGMQIIDLSRVDENIVELKRTYTVNNLVRVHTIQANPISKSLYLNGSNRGFLILDATDPENPVEVARWTTKYVHDSQVVNYTSGPYAGKEIGFFCCGSAGFYIVDLTDRGNLTVLSNLSYLTGSFYTHSGQLTADRKYFLINDEFDEANALTNNCSTHVVNVEDLSNPTYLGAFVNPIGAIDHNSQVIGNTLYLASYKEGLRIYDVANPLNIKELGYFDTFPSGTGFSFDGAWGTYAFPSGNAIISDISGGLFVLDPTEAAGLGAPPLSVTPTIGQETGGGPSSLRKADRSYYRMQWELGTLGTREPTFQFVIEAESSVTPAMSLDVTVGGLPARFGGATIRVELYNWQSGAYDKVGAVPVTKISPSGTVNGLNGSKYVGTDGKIRARITAISDGSFAARVDNFNFDIVRFDVRRS